MVVVLIWVGLSPALLACPSCGCNESTHHVLCQALPASVSGVMLEQAEEACVAGMRVLACHWRGISCTAC